MTQPSGQPAQQRSNRHEPLFEPIAFEVIEVEQPQQPAQKVPAFARSQLAILLVAYLVVFVGNGEITIPLFLALPEVLLNIGQAAFEILLPCLIGTAGVMLAAYRLVKEAQTPQQHGHAHLGIILMLTSLFFFWGVSEAAVATFFSALPLIGLYLYFNQQAPKV